MDAMNELLKGIQAEDGAAVAVADIPKAVTAARLVYGDGATQLFTVDGRTTYSERGGDSAGEWTSTTTAGSVRSGRLRTEPATYFAGWSRTAASSGSDSPAFVTA